MIAYFESVIAPLQTHWSHVAASISQSSVVRAPIAETLKYTLCSLCLNTYVVYERSKKSQFKIWTKQNKTKEQPPINKPTTKGEQKGHAVQSALSDSWDTVLVSARELVQVFLTVWARPFMAKPKAAPKAVSVFTAKCGSLCLSNTGKCAAAERKSLCLRFLYRSKLPFVSSKLASCVRNCHVLRVYKCFSFFK